MKTNYLLTITSSEAVESKSIISVCGDIEILSKNLRSSKYNLEIKRINSDCLQALSFEETIKWLKEIVLYKEEYILTKIIPRVIHLPEGIFFEDGFLKIKTVNYSQHTVESCRKEIQLMNWIVETFPKAQYAKYRNIFTLGIKSEEFADKLHTTKYIYTVSVMEQKDIIVNKNVYKRTLVEL